MTHAAFVGRPDGVRQQVHLARTAARVLAGASRQRKDAALAAMADALEAHVPEILSANAADLVNAEGGDMSAALLDRLRLTDQRITEMAEAVRELIRSPTQSAKWSVGRRCPTV